MADRRQSGLSLTWQLVTLVVAMFGFGFLLVPLYDVFCDITGVNGKTDDRPAQVVEAPDPDRLVTVEFLGSVNQNAPWEFRPSVTKMQVHPGKLYDTTFFARNLADEAVVGQAVPSVSPGQAAKYFQKTECFCFTDQAFAAGEGRDMPVRFILDPAIPAHVETVTLSYTFFATNKVAAR